MGVRSPPIKRPLKVTILAPFPLVPSLYHFTYCQPQSSQKDLCSRFFWRNKVRLPEVEASAVPGRGPLGLWATPPLSHASRCHSVRTTHSPMTGDPYPDYTKNSNASVRKRQTPSRNTGDSPQQPLHRRVSPNGQSTKDWRQGGMRRAASRTDGQMSLRKAPRHRWCSRNTQNGAARPPSPLAPHQASAAFQL